MYIVHVSTTGQLAVDVFRAKRGDHIKWRSYYNVAGTSLSRLRRIFTRCPGLIYVWRGWSPLRYEAYKRWLAGRQDPVGCGRPSLDLPVTNGHSR